MSLLCPVNFAACYRLCYQDQELCSCRIVVMNLIQPHLSVDYKFRNFSKWNLLTCFPLFFYIIENWHHNLLICICLQKCWPAYRIFPAQLCIFPPLSSNICIFLCGFPFTLLTALQTFPKWCAAVHFIGHFSPATLLCSAILLRCSTLHSFHLIKFWGDFLLLYALYACSLFFNDAANSALHHGFGKIGFTVYSSVDSLIAPVNQI